MAPSLRPGTSRLRGFAQLTPWLLLISGLIVVRLSKGAGFTDAYALLSRPFWPGPAQREWIVAATDLEQASRLKLLREITNVCVASWLYSRTALRLVWCLRR